MSTAAFNQMSLHDLDDGLLIPLTQVPVWIERLTGRRVSHQAVWKWTKRGLSVPGGRDQLAAFQRGRRLYTTGRALRVFLMG